MIQEKPLAHGDHNLITARNWKSIVRKDILILNLVLHCSLRFGKIPVVSGISGTKLDDLPYMVVFVFLGSPDMKFPSSPFG